MVRIVPALAVLALAFPALAQQDEPTPLPPIDVTRERNPLDSDRARYQRITPCLGCDATEAADDFLVSVLNFVIVPGPATDDIPPEEISPPLARFDDKHRP